MGQRGECLRAGPIGAAVAAVLTLNPASALCHLNRDLVKKCCLFASAKR